MKPEIMLQFRKTSDMKDFESQISETSTDREERKEFLRRGLGSHWNRYVLSFMLRSPTKATSNICLDQAGRLVVVPLTPGP